MKMVLTQAIWSEHTVCKFYTQNTPNYWN